MLLLGAAAATAPVLAPGWAPARADDPGAGDPARGERIFQRCFSCHSVDPNERATLQGPSLWRVVGRRAAAVPGFGYSDALAARGAAGLVWTAATLDAFIADPQAAVPGVAMGFFGLDEPQDRADVIAYLRAAGGAP